jgi:hypothetical protein
MTRMPSLEEVDARLRSLGADVILTAEDERAIANLNVIRFPAASPVASRGVAERRPARRRIGRGQIMNRPYGRVVLVLLTLAMLLVLGGMAVAADAFLAASQPPKQISEKEAVADAMRQLPNNGAGYTVAATQLEPGGSPFDFTGPSGQGFGEDKAKECLIIPPLPPLPFLPCRDYPVWVVALSSQNCDVIIAINGFTGRFGGAGVGYRAGAQATPGPSDSCGITPGGGTTTAPGWWQPVWN